MRRFGEPILEDRFYRPRPGAYGILLREGRILLTRQEYPTPELQLPGGGIDPGENSLQALHREVMEETGWRISVERKLGFYQRYTYLPDYEYWAQKICHIYLCRPAFQVCPPTEPFHSALWLSGHEAVEQLSNEGDRTFLAELLLSR